MEAEPDQNFSPYNCSPYAGAGAGACPLLFKSVEAGFTATALTAKALTATAWGFPITSALLGTTEGVNDNEIDGVKPSEGDIKSDGVDIAPPSMGTIAALDGICLIVPAAVRICAALGEANDTQIATAINGFLVILNYINGE